MFSLLAASVLAVQGQQFPLADGSIPATPQAVFNLEPQGTLGRLGGFAFSVDTKKLVVWREPFISIGFVDLEGKEAGALRDLALPASPLLTQEPQWVWVMEGERKAVNKGGLAGRVIEDTRRFVPFDLKRERPLKGWVPESVLPKRGDKEMVSDLERRKTFLLNSIKSFTFSDDLQHVAYYRPTDGQHYIVPPGQQKEVDGRTVCDVGDGDVPLLFGSVVIVDRKSGKGLRVGPLTQPSGTALARTVGSWMESVATTVPTREGRKFGIDWMRLDDEKPLRPVSMSFSPSGRHLAIVVRLQGSEGLVVASTKDGSVQRFVPPADAGHGGSIYWLEDHVLLWGPDLKPQCAGDEPRQVSRRVLEVDVDSGVQREVVLDATATIQGRGVGHSKNKSFGIWTQPLPDASAEMRFGCPRPTWVESMVLLEDLDLAVLLVSNRAQWSNWSHQRGSSVYTRQRRSALELVSIESGEMIGLIPLPHQNPGTWISASGDGTLFGILYDDGRVEVFKTEDVVAAGRSAISELGR